MIFGAHSKESQHLVTLNFHPSETIFLSHLSKPRWVMDRKRGSNIEAKRQKTSWVQHNYMFYLIFFDI